MASVQRIVIPNWRPWPDNKLLDCHWRIKHKRKSEDRDMIAAYARISNALPATGKRRVQLEITLTGRQKKTDPMAYQKSCLDALVKCRMLIDDSAEFVEWIPPVYTRGKTAQCVIVLEDVW